MKYILTELNENISELGHPGAGVVKMHTMQLVGVQQGAFVAGHCLSVSTPFVFLAHAL